MLTSRDGPQRTHCSRVVKGRLHARDAGTDHWSPDYLIQPHPASETWGKKVTGPWIRKTARPRGKAARREERLQRRLMREGRTSQVLDRLRSSIRRKLVTVFERRPGMPAAPIVVPGGGRA